MKRLIIVLVAIALIFGGVAFAANMNKDKPAEAAPAAETEAGTVSASTTIDYDAMKGKYSPDFVVLNIDGKDITWDEYFAFFYSSAETLNQYFDYYAMYGADVDWSSVYDEETGTTFAEIPAQETEKQLISREAVLGFAAEKGIELSDESKANVKSQIEEMEAKAEAEGGLEALLADNYMSMDMYEGLMSVSELYKQLSSDLFGKDYADVSDEDAVSYLEDKDYVHANHILLLTMDMETYEELPEEDAQAAKDLADKLYSELSEIKDDAERLERFKAMKEEYDQDSGKTANPDGYTYTPGTMVTEFESAAKALENYQISEPVKSTYGYHIIMRLPLDPDAMVSDSGDQVSARQAFASESLNSQLNDYGDRVKIVYTDGFKAPLITDFIRK